MAKICLQAFILSTYKRLSANDSLFILKIPQKLESLFFSQNKNSEDACKEPSNIYERLVTWK